MVRGSLPAISAADCRPTRRHRREWYNDTDGPVDRHTPTIQLNTAEAPHGHGHTDIRTRTYGHGHTDTDIRTRTYGHGHTDTDIRTRTYGHGHTDTDIRTRTLASLQKEAKLPWGQVSALNCLKLCLQNQILHDFFTGYTTVNFLLPPSRCYLSPPC